MERNRPSAARIVAYSGIPKSRLPEKNGENVKNDEVITIPVAQIPRIPPEFLVEDRRISLSQCA
jgi:hypothetical protein